MSDASGPPTDGGQPGERAPGDLDAALRAWRRDLGEEHVITTPAVLERYARSTIARPVRAVAVVMPASQAEVVATVRTAAEHRVPLYPISRGKSWGYGDACPVTEGNAILDLSRMNRIRTVDPDLAYAVIEPGVTQGQLSEHLRSQGIALWPDCTGAGPDTSIVGNVLDRGFGHTPYGNRAQFVSGLEVVLADGRVLRTGFGHYEKARSSHLFPYGIGPSLDGLFVQSNLGIVTAMGIWLMRAPEAYSLFICSLERDEDIFGFVEDLRPLRLDGTLRSVIHMGNDLRVISGGMAFPRDRFPQAKALPKEYRQTLRRSGGIGAWMVAGGLYGSKGMVAAGRREVRRRLSGPHRTLHFFDERKLDTLERLTRPLSSLRRVAALRSKLASVRAVYDMNRGIPSQRFLAGAYWRHRQGLPADFSRADPAEDGCGLLWFPPVLPFTGEAVREFLALAEPFFARYGFDFFVTLSSVTERSLGAVMTIAYDQQDEAETAAARDCAAALCEAMMDAGFPPYRVSPAFLPCLARGSETFWDVVADMKRLMDPEGILSPGRYRPPPPSSDA